MNERLQIIKAWENLSNPEMPCALATVIQVEGSSYRGVGSRMLIMENGQWLGGISGGCLEGDALRKAKMAMFQGREQRVIYDTSGEDGHRIGAGLGCDGRIEVLIASLPVAKDRNPLLALKESLKSREAQVLVTVIASKVGEVKPGEAFLMTSKSQLPTALSQLKKGQEMLGMVKRCIDSELSDIVDLGEGLEFLIEFLAPPLELLIFGGRYDVIPLVRLAMEL